MTTDALTERERECLEHLQRAEELEVTLRVYADAYGLDVKDLYYGKRQLAKKGVLGAPPTTPGDFIPVQVASEPTSKTPDAVVRLCHPSGWTVESTDWPPAEWLALLLSSSTKPSP